MKHQLAYFCRCNQLCEASGGGCIATTSWGIFVRLGVGSRQQPHVLAGGNVGGVKGKPVSAW